MRFLLRRGVRKWTFLALPLALSMPMNCYGDLVVLADFGTASSKSRVATAKDFIDLGVKNLTGSEGVLNVSGTDRAVFSSVSYYGSELDTGVYARNTSAYTFVNSQGSELFRTFSLSDSQEAQRQASSDNAGTNVLRDYIHITRNNTDPTNDQGRVMELTNLGLVANQRYRLSLFGHLGKGRTAGDVYWTDSKFEPINSNNVIFESTESGVGELVIEFETTENFSSADSVNFRWSLCEGAQFGTLNGFAVQHVSAVPEPSVGVVLCGLCGVAILRRKRTR